MLPGAAILTIFSLLQCMLFFCTHLDLPVPGFLAFRVCVYIANTMATIGICMDVWMRNDSSSGIHGTGNGRQRGWVTGLCC